MTGTALIGRTEAIFERRFGLPPEIAAFAPGRVNLLGEHTDYNGGHVLPIVFRDLGVAAAIARGPVPDRVEIYSDTLEESEHRDIYETRAGNWSDFVLGCLKAAARDAIIAQGCRVAVATTLPLGAGLGSSAAIEVAMLRAIGGFLGRGLSPFRIAVTARAVENDFVGMPCGIMDQFASSVGTPGEALILNTRTLEYDSAPGPEGHAFVVIHSGISHQLTEVGYARRVSQCNAACEALGVDLLCDLGAADLARVARLPEPLNRRARHVITDNLRVLDGLAALKAGEVAEFGRLMNESHASQRDDFQITIPETDALVERAGRLGALGARQTGGGWGGAVVALVRAADVADFTAGIVGDAGAARIVAVT